MDEKDLLLKRIKELEIELEDVKNLSRTRSKLLEANIKELNEVYNVLNEKFKELQIRNKKIKAIEDELVRANKLSALGELAGSIAHEIKNPLISIQGFAKRIQKINDISKIEKYSRFIDKEAGRLSAVLTKLLEFSRMEQPKTEDINLNDLIDDTLLFMEHHLTRFKNVELRIKKEERLPLIRADRIHIQQSLVNFIINAAQSMPHGGLISIMTGMDNTYVFVSVSDNGVGIKKEEMEKIFEPYFTTKKSGEGTGLGLSLCKRLIEANKGKIEVESKEGVGSTFKILIPYKS